MHYSGRRHRGWARRTRRRGARPGARVCPVDEPDKTGGTRAPDHGLPSALTTEHLQTQFAVTCFAVLRRVAYNIEVRAPRNAHEFPSEGSVFHTQKSFNPSVGRAWEAILLVAEQHV